MIVIGEVRSCACKLVRNAISVCHPNELLRPRYLQRNKLRLLPNLSQVINVKI